MSAPGAQACLHAQLEVGLNAAWADAQLRQALVRLPFLLECGWPSHSHGLAMVQAMPSLAREFLDQKTKLPASAGKVESPLEMEKGCVFP